MSDTLFKIMMILMAANGLALLYMLVFHCNTGWDGYGMKWDSDRSRRIANLLLVVWFLILFGCAKIKCMMI